MNLVIRSHKTNKRVYELDLSTPDRRTLCKCCKTIEDIYEKLMSDEQKRRGDVSQSDLKFKELVIHEDINNKDKIMLVFSGLRTYGYPFELTKHMLDLCYSNAILYHDIKTNENRLIYLSAKVIEHTSNIVESLIGAYSIERIRLYREKDIMWLSVTLED